jgi:tetratricopeptide (TPR) repeat protein
MADEFPTLTVTELLALAVEASRRGDTGHAIEYLKVASRRTDATAPICFLLGSEYAQIGLTSAAIEQFQRAVEIDPSYAIARFQLGLLFYAQQDLAAATQAWAPLASLGDAHPLALFQAGLRRLADGEIDLGLACLSKGIAANQLYPPLNADMARLADGVKRTARSGIAETPNETEEDTGHLLLNIYTRGQVH